MCMYTSIYMHHILTCIQTVWVPNMYKEVGSSIIVYTCIRLHTYIHTYAHTYIHDADTVHQRMVFLTYTHTYIHTLHGAGIVYQVVGMPTNGNTYIHTYINTYIHTCCRYRIPSGWNADEWSQKSSKQQSNRCLRTEKMVRIPTKRNVRRKREWRASRRSKRGKIE